MSLRLVRDGPVARLMIDRAAKRNAMTQAMWLMLPPLVAEAMADASVRVLIVQAAEPGAFSAGADIAELAAAAGDVAWMTANQAAIAQAQYELVRAPKPTVALVEGDCIGGGCGIAIACDLRIAAPAARFGITPARLGLTYSLHDTKLLVDLVGPAQAKRLLFTAGLVYAEEAHRIGLADLLGGRAEADRLAVVIAENSADSTARTKALIRRILDGQTAEDDATRALVAEAFTLPDFAEGVAAFLAKRPPAFR